ncbi:MarR family winged helix-turn-helix transcriptional regulator [Methanobacterium sp. BAmetb5]|jgi:MarR family transcriptional regulator for hemolysin|uniref:MarR family winged helix-turn-helix transcriptional regulator n=1 Tax=Methanobacterium sp. BAmetb5 TaxID=2025351 RepID=UPI000E818476|nr:MarR family transcriptional regulator [Methanobacterium sp. BAmetb5]AXV40471.1 MAG: MarR family transcriptional regulator [Methanobacterium sp. BAmetb5]
MNDENKSQCPTMCSCLYFTSNKLNRILNKMAEEEFLKTGLSPSHALTLMNIDFQPGLSQKELSEIMNIKPSTTTRFIDKLETRGLVERKTKGKSSYLYPTPKGIDLQVEISQCWANLYKRYTKVLGQEKGVELTEIIDKAATKLEDNIHE